MKVSSKGWLGLLLMIASIKTLPAQDCVLQPPAIKIDFGSRTTPSSVRIPVFKNYEQISGECPQDGLFSVVPSVMDCLDGNWFNIPEDHTYGDDGGNMLVVNGAYDAGPFFGISVSGLKPNTEYELASWITNICARGVGCDPIKPNLLFRLEDGGGKAIGSFMTGEIAPRAGAWKQYTARFTTPVTATTLALTIETRTSGGCGNDFAMDDITFRECKIITPPVAEAPAKPVKEDPVIVQKKVVAPPVKKEEKKTTPPAPLPAKIILKDTVVKTKPVAAKSNVKLPTPLATRSNPVAKQIELPAGEILIELYDNGEIDGDIISIYHNNELVADHKLLSDKAIRLPITLNDSEPHHEIVMVANNLGSIPPNTSLMVVTAGKKRYEVFISSTEQKNAKVIIDLAP